ncbi:heparinase II/III-family protein, partial [Calditrichota bacterium]
GTVPMWGDSDYGRALGLGQNKDFWDLRPILSVGAVLFSRPDWKFAAGRFDEEAFWLLGSDGLELWNNLDVYPPKQTSQDFPDAGMYIIRDNWNIDTDVAFFRCGSFGLGGEGQCAHSHCDLLSFVLWINGQPLLVDSGTYRYHGHWRDHFRLTSAHNTVLIDGQEQAIPKPNFSWQKIPEARCLNWSGESVIGAIKYNNQVEFFREVSHQQSGNWNLYDKFKGQNIHIIEWNFNFAPGLDLYLNCEEHILNIYKKDTLILNVHIPHNRLMFQLQNSWYSNQYGAKHQNKRLNAKWQGELNNEGVQFHWHFQPIIESPTSTLN